AGNRAYAIPDADIAVSGCDIGTGTCAEKRIRAASGVGEAGLKTEEGVRYPAGVRITGLKADKSILGSGGVGKARFGTEEGVPVSRGVGLARLVTDETVRGAAQVIETRTHADEGVIESDIEEVYALAARIRTDIQIAIAGNYVCLWPANAQDWTFEDPKVARVLLGRDRFCVDGA